MVNAESKEKAMKIYEEDKMIKRILKIWFTIAMYELGKWIGRELYFMITANDDVEVPKDFDEDDHAHLNGLWKEVFK